MEPEMQPITTTLVVEDLVKSQLTNAAKWAKFLAIIGFIVSGLLAIAAFGMGSIMSMIPQESTMIKAGSGLAITIVYLIIALLYFLPCLYLFRFAARMQNALRQDQQETFLNSLNNLRRFFKYLGILTVIYLVIIVLATLAAMVGGMIGMMSL